MTRSRVQRLARLLPKGCQYFGELERVRGEDGPSLAEADPRFGWHLVGEFALRGEALPSEVTEAFLVKAYQHMTGMCYHGEVEEGRLISKWHARRVANILKGLLISGQLSFEDIAGRLGMGIGTVKAFEGLFFNVCDRLSEITYILKILDPGGPSTPGLELLRSGYYQGAEEVLFLSGLRSDPLKDKSKTEIKEEIENKCAAAALRGVKEGKFSAKDNPALQAYQKQYAAGQKKEQQQGDGFDEDNLDLSAANPGQAAISQICSIYRKARDAEKMKGNRE